MEFREAIQSHLVSSGESMRALSLRSGLNPKAVSDILNRPRLRPTARTCAALSTAIGQPLPMPMDPGAKTYATLIREIHARAHTDAERKKARRVESRVRWFLRNTNQVAETAKVDRDAERPHLSGPI